MPLLKEYQVDIRIVRDVRAMGAVGYSPTVSVEYWIEHPSSIVEVVESLTLVADVVDGVLASDLASITVRNNSNNWIALNGIESLIAGIAVAVPVHRESYEVAPGQTRPYCFRIAGFDKIPNILKLRLKYVTCEGKQWKDDGAGLVFGIEFRRRLITEPHKVTHLHPSGIVSYAILRPPSAKAAEQPSTARAPVFLQLHGAGVEAEWDMVAHSMDPLPDLCAFVLFPTGVTRWSGDDWHTWGFADVEAAIANIPNWIRRTGYSLLDVDTACWLMSGHSNGGQGTWYAVTHRPDKILGAAPVSGYLSIPSYVPQSFWRPMDPRRRAILDAATSTTRLELLATNCEGILIHQQHGTHDDNVPPFQSRLMAQLLSENTQSGSSLVELPGCGHWFDGIMTTPRLSDFYQRVCDDYQRDGTGRIVPFERFQLQEFCVTVGNPADTGPKFGIEILFLQDPAGLGQIRVHVAERVWKVRTKNVLAFQYQDALCVPQEHRPQSLVVAGQRISIDRVGGNRATVFLASDGWKVSSGTDPFLPRRRHQLGGIDAILRSTGPFHVRHCTAEGFAIAAQISRNLFQYLRADCRITSCAASVQCVESGVSLVTIGVGNSLPDGPPGFPFRIAEDQDDRRHIVTGPKGIKIKAEVGRLGAIFLRPLTDHGAPAIELVVWGERVDEAAWAARFIPTVTGVGQPDFIIFDDRIRWSGADAAAVGVFDAFWQLTPGSVVEL